VVKIRKKGRKKEGKTTSYVYAGGKGSVTGQGGTGQFGISDLTPVIIGGSKTKPRMVWDSF